MCYHVRTGLRFWACFLWFGNQFRVGKSILGDALPVFLATQWVLAT